MLVSKYLTASLTALAVIGSAGYVSAQTAPSNPSPGPGDISSQDRNTGGGSGTLNQGTANQGTGTMNQGTANQGTGTTMGQGSNTNQGTGTMSQDRDTVGQGTGSGTNQGTSGMGQDRSVDQRLAARADRN